MADAPMVHVATSPNAVHARIIAARLGSEGIVWTLRGEDSIYPCGGVDVLVAADDAARATELLLADEVETAFWNDDLDLDGDDLDGLDLDDGDLDDGASRIDGVQPLRGTTWVVIAVTLAVLVSLTLTRVVMTSEAAGPARDVIGEGP